METVFKGQTKITLTLLSHVLTCPFKSAFEVIKPQLQFGNLVCINDALKRLVHNILKTNHVLFSLQEKFVQSLQKTQVQVMWIKN